MFVTFVEDSSRTFSVRRNFLNPDTFDVSLANPEVATRTDLSADLNYTLLVKNSDCLNLTLDFGNFIDSPYFYGGFEFTLDSVSIVMVVTITTISALVHFYSTAYMRADPHAVRFFVFLSIFTFFMLVLVMSSNLVMLYIGWEGVGLSSYLLIAF